MSGKLIDRFRNAIVRGAMFIAPIWLSIFIVGFGYNMIESSLGEISAQLVRWFVPQSWLPARFASGHIPGISVLFAVIALSTIGSIASAAASIAFASR